MYCNITIKIHIKIYLFLIIFNRPISQDIIMDTNKKIFNSKINNSINIKEKHQFNNISFLIYGSLFLIIIFIEIILLWTFGYIWVNLKK